MASKLQKKNRKWTFRYLEEQKHKRYICQKTSYQDAEQELIDFLSAFKALKNKKDDSKILWKDFCVRFLEYVKRNKKAPEAYILHINNFNNALKITYVSEANTAKFNEYIDIRIQSGISKSTINRELNTFRMLFSWAIDIEDFQLKHPLKRKIKRFKTKAVVKTRVLTSAEINKAFTCIKDNVDDKGQSLGLDEQTRDMLLVLLHCRLYAGLRLKEAKLLKRKDILFDKASILIEPQKTSESNPNIVSIPLESKLKDFCINLFKRYPKEIYATSNIQESARTSRSAVISI
ncbi:MAG: hypothetical protein LBV16_05555 [Elusimicrobiota bacterium]|nr:hypothetical protein [Elusimicrobiota bacterium]